MITQLYIEKRADRDYEVVCNDLFVVASPFETFPEWLGQSTGIQSAIEVLTQSHIDECEDIGDVAGIRVGYQPMDMLRLMFQCEMRLVPDFMVEGAMMRLAGEAAS